ncbi:polysaccharide deacetylase family protein [Candidatus Curtissbacteria bacterium]|nr:polysaccharide deacetylase family protein [Candidatus Curtissbacteria bacterium]
MNPDRSIARRAILRSGLGAGATLFGLGGDRRTSGLPVFPTEEEYLRQLALEHLDQEQVRLLAANCNTVCGGQKFEGSLVLAQEGPALVSGNKFIYLVTDVAREEFSPAPVLPPPPPEPEPVPKLLRPQWERKYLLAPVLQGPSDRPLVGLTVDDGYFARDEILNTLIAKDVSATFFIIGQVMEQYPDFVRKARDSGRIKFGNHTYTHTDLRFKNWDQIANGEMKRSEDVLMRIAGETTIPFGRPFGGNRNTSVDTAFADRGFRPILWNVSGDAGTQWSSFNPTALADYYLALLRNQRNPWGSIILTHFRESTGISRVAGVPSALEQIIDGVRAMGMEPVGLDKLYEDGRV